MKSLKIFIATAPACHFTSTVGGLFSSYQAKFDFITPHQWRLLEDYHNGLLDWNAKVNLISRKEINAVIPRHIIPCLSLSLVKKFQSNESVVDVGSGGG